MTRISLEILHGSASVQDDDRERAVNAAEAVIDAAGTTVDIAFAEFKRQWGYLGSDEAADAGISHDYDNLTGLALVWVEAEKSADLALTFGWANPDGANCGISA